PHITVATLTEAAVREPLEKTGCTHFYQ
ncbi:hypothetical protein PMI28_00065, partial [Pseudomonas sp. GM48]